MHAGPRAAPRQAAWGGGSALWVCSCARGDSGQGWGGQWVCRSSTALQSSLRNYGGFGGRGWAASEPRQFWSGVLAWAAPACDSSLYLNPTGETRGPAALGGPPAELFPLGCDCQGLAGLAGWGWGDESRPGVVSLASLSPILTVVFAEVCDEFFISREAWRLVRVSSGKPSDFTGSVLKTRRSLL